MIKAPTSLMNRRCRHSDHLQLLLLMVRRSKQGSHETPILAQRPVEKIITSLTTTEMSYGQEEVTDRCHRGCKIERADPAVRVVRKGVETREKVLEEAAEKMEEVMVEVGTTMTEEKTMIVKRFGAPLWKKHTLKSKGSRVRCGKKMSLMRSGSVWQTIGIWFVRTGRGCSRWYGSWLSDNPPDQAVTEHRNHSQSLQTELKQKDFSFLTRNPCKVSQNISTV